MVFVFGEEVVQPGKRVELRLIVGVGVDLQRDGQARVAEDDLRVAGRDAEGLQQRGNRVADVMKLDQPDIARLADAVRSLTSRSASRSGSGSRTADRRRARRVSWPKSPAQGES